MFKAGAAAGDVTPAIGTELCGYGPYLGRKATGVLDPLATRVLYLDDGEGRALLVANDLVGVSAGLTDRFRGLCERHLDLAPECVMVTGTHTHSGPATIELYGWGEKNELYIEHLPYVWLETAERAIADAKPAEMRLASGPIEPISLDRHTADGPIDEEIRVAVFEADGGPVAILVNHSAHGVIFGQENTLISADWPGWLERTLEERYPGCVAAFVQGSCGTINTLDACLDLEHGRPRIEAVGKQVAAEAARLLDAATRVCDDIEVLCSLKHVPLPLDVPSRDEIVALREAELARANDESLKEYDRALARLFVRTLQKLIDSYRDGPAETCPADVQVLRAGPLRIVGLPGEPFMELGHRIMSARGDGMVMVAGYTNDFLGYFPTRGAYEDKQRYIYPVEMVPRILGRFPFRSGVGELLVKTATGILDTF